MFLLSIALTKLLGLVWFGLWCLTPLSTIYQLYHDDSDRQVPDSDVEKDKGTVFDCDITLHNPDGDKTF
jgi:hypothetical protein